MVSSRRLLHDFWIAFFDTDDMTQPKSKQEFLYALANKHSMYYLDTEHIYACNIELREEGDDVRCIGIPFAEGEDNKEWVIAETDCAGVFKINRDMLELQYESYCLQCQTCFVEAWESESGRICGCKSK